MSDLEVRLFEDDASIFIIGESLLDCTLPRDDWTHEAHLAACTWIVRDRPDIVPEREMASIISAFNVSVGTVNDDSQGYHESITQVYIAAVRAHLNGKDGQGTLSRSLMPFSYPRVEGAICHFDFTRVSSYFWWRRGGAS